MNILLTTLNAKYIHKNLALRYLYVTKPEGFTCDILEYTIKDDCERIVIELLEKNYDAIGFSTYIWNIEQTSTIVKQLKAKRPEMIIVMGGPEVSFDGAHFVQELGIDAVICGEGEFAFWEYLSERKKRLHQERMDIDETNKLATIPGLFTPTTTPNIPYAMVDLKQLETYPQPYFLPFDKASMSNRYFYMETSRGCPYRCRYCLSSVQGNVRMFSSSYVTAVLDNVFSSDARQIKFLDRTFNVDKHRALAFASYIQDHAKPSQIFQFEIMAEYVSDELIAYLKQKPKYPQFRFEIGIQSTNQRALQEIDRVQNMERLTNVIHQLQASKHHELHVDLIAGLPYEDVASFRQSFNAVFALQADELQLGFLKLLRGTTLRTQAETYGMIYDAKAPYEVSCTKWVSEQDMDEIHDVCFALDALYNTPRLRTTLQALLEETGTKPLLTPYQLFYLLGKPMRQTKYKQLDELFRMLYDILSEFYPQDFIHGMLCNDYYRLFKQRPKRFAYQQISNAVRDNIYTLLTKHPSYQYSINELRHYGLLDYGYVATNEERFVGKSDGTRCDVMGNIRGEVGYLFVLYNNKQTFPQRFIIDANITQVRQLGKGE